MSYVSFLFLISRPVWCWFISDYHCSTVPRNPPKKNTCTSLDVNMWTKKEPILVGSERLLPAKGFRWAPDSCGTTSAAEKPKGWYDFCSVSPASVVSCKVVTINKAAKLLRSSWELLTSCMSTGMRSGKKKTIYFTQIPLWWLLPNHISQIICVCPLCTTSGWIYRFLHHEVIKSCCSSCFACIKVLRFILFLAREKVANQKKITMGKVVIDHVNPLGPWSLHSKPMPPIRMGKKGSQRFCMSSSAKRLGGASVCNTPKRFA